MSKYSASLHKKWRDAHKHEPEFLRKEVVIATRHHQKLRQQVMEHYGGTELKCACCGESEYKFLVLDHINNDGAEKRRFLVVKRKNGDI